MRLQHICNVSPFSNQGNGSDSEQHVHSSGHCLLQKHFGRHLTQSTCSGALCSARLAVRMEQSLPASLNPKEKHQNLQSRNITFPSSGQKGSKQKASPHIHLHFSGLGDSFWACFANEAPEASQLWLRAGFEIQDQLCGLLSRRCERHQHFPAEHKSVCNALQVPPSKISYSETSSGSSFKSSWSSFSSCSSLLDFSWMISPGVFKNLQHIFSMALRACPNTAPKQAVNAGALALVS